MNKQVLAIGMNDLFVQREIEYQLSRHECDVNDESNKDNLDLLNERLKNQVWRLQAMHRSFEKEQLAAHQRQIIIDAFRGINAANKRDLESEALFDQNGFAEVFAIAHRIGKVGKYEKGNDPAAISFFCFFQW